MEIRGAEERMASDGGLDRVEREHRASPIDVHVGSRVRLRRTLLGMSQESSAKPSASLSSRSRSTNGA